MKRNIPTAILYAALALFTLSLNACSQEDDFAPQGGEDEFHVVTRSANEDANEVFTCDFTLLLFNQTDRTKNEKMNMIFNTNGGYQKTIKSSVLPADVVAYNRYMGVTIKGYGDYSFIPNENQSNKNLFESSDGMIATGTATKGSTLLLNFKHVFAKVLFKVTLGSEFISSENINKVYVAATGLSYFVETFCENKHDEYIAHTAAGTYAKGSVFVKVEIGEYTGDKALVVKLPEDLNLEAGKSYIFNLSVHKNKILLNTDNSHPFGDGWNVESELN